MGKSSFDSKQAREVDGTYLEYNVIQESTDEAFLSSKIEIPIFWAWADNFGR